MVYLSQDAQAYYEGAHRVMRGGVPCRVARKPRKEHREFVKLLEHVVDGELKELPALPDMAQSTFIGSERLQADDTFGPVSFTFERHEIEKLPEQRASRSSSGTKNGVRDYYKSGYRIVIGGVPCRVACKPHTKNHLTMLRQSKGLHDGPWSDYERKRLHA